MYFPQISNKRVPFLFKKAKHKRVPDRNMVPPTRLIPHSYFVGAKTTSPPAAKPRRPPSATTSHPSTAALLHHAGADTPTSSSTATSTATPSWLVVEAEAEPSVPEPVQPRRPAPHRCRSNFATLHLTGVVPATPSFAASDLLPLRRHTAMATQSTIWPWVRPSLHSPEHRFAQ